MRTTEQDRYQYGYDRNSNRTYRDNLVNTAFGELYAYDNLNQIVDFQRGTLNSTKTAISGTASRTQSWDFDVLGNFDSQTNDSVTQTRTANKQNEITSISGASTPTYDSNGNMLTDESGKQFVFDAWNRLKIIKDSSGNTLKFYAYDALTHRISETAGSNTTDLYYSAGWQVLEERVNGSGKYRYIWSPVYVDAMILRDRLDASERLWVQQDANFNVTALVDNSGNVVERYVYDPFGKATVLDASWGTQSISGYTWVYLHQGGRLDATSGLYHFRNRDYSPTLGRWVSMDPIRYMSLNTDLYLYNTNNSILYLDSEGLLELKAAEVSRPVMGKCGEFFWGINWKFSEAVEQGVIIQHVIMTEWVVPCKCAFDEHELDKIKPKIIADYWEAWVIAGKAAQNRIFPTRLRGVSGDIDDTFAYEGKRSDSAGVFAITAEAFYIQGADVMKSGMKFRTVPHAGPLWSSYSKPVFNSNNVKASINREIAVAWNCCDEKESTTELLHTR